VFVTNAFTSAGYAHLVPVILRLARCIAVVVVILFAGSAAACGGNDDDAEAQDDQPATDASAFTSGAFDELPKLPRMREVGAFTERGGVEVQSYEVDTLTPEQAIREYHELVTESWQPLSPPEQPANSAWRAMYANDGRYLVVSTSEAPTLPEEGDATSTVQLSLTLYGPGAQRPTFDDPQ
jgi:hypothetical protein